MELLGQVIPPYQDAITQAADEAAKATTAQLSPQIAYWQTQDGIDAKAADRNKTLIVVGTIAGLLFGILTGWEAPALIHGL